MRQLNFIAPGRFEWHDIPAPKVEDRRHAIVRPLAVARCDLDLYIATGVVRMPAPFAFGHEMIAEVVDAGDGAGVTQGMRVAVPFQISCGSCDPCRRGFTASCTSVPPLAAFGLGGGRTEFGGALSDLVRVPFADAMLVPLPDGVDPVVAASASDNIADGWRAVAPQLAAMPGAPVLVIGGLAQSVGLYAAGAAVAQGSGRVLYLDDNTANAARAAAMGAETGALTDYEAREQFDIVVEAAGTAEALALAIRSCAPNGQLTVVSIHLSPTTAVPLTQAYYKGLTIHTSRVSSRRWLPDVLSCLACGKLDPAHVTHEVLPFAEAGEAMADPGPKLVFVP